MSAYCRSNINKAVAQTLQGLNDEPPPRPAENATAGTSTNTPWMITLPSLPHSKLLRRGYAWAASGPGTPNSILLLPRTSSTHTGRATLAAPAQLWASPPYIVLGSTRRWNAQNGSSFL